MRACLAAICLLPLLANPVYISDYTGETAEDLGIYAVYDTLTEDESAVIGEMSFDGSMDIGRIMKDISAALAAKLRQTAGEIQALAVTLCAAAFACAMFKSVCGDRTTGEYIEIIICAACIPLLVGDVRSLSAGTEAALYRLSGYSEAGLPAVFAAAAAGGALSSAAVKYAAMSFALEVLMYLSQTMVLPFINALLALSIADSIFPNPFLHSVCAFINKTCVLVLTGLCTLFTVYLSCAGALSSAVDAASIKTAKSVISTALPVVGGVISDASAAILSAAGIIRTCAGSFGLAAVCVICLAPFCGLMLRLLMLKLALAIAKCLPVGRLCALYSGCVQAVSMLMGLLGACSVMLFISLMSVLKAVNV